MKTTLLSTLISVALLFTSASHARTVEELAKLGATLYSQFQSNHQLYSLLKVGASESDQKYLDGVIASTKLAPLPKMTAEGAGFRMQGLDALIRIEDLAKNEYSYSGRKFPIDLNRGVQVTMKDIEAAFFPKPSAFFDVILPKAHAGLESTDLLNMIGGGAAVGGVMNYMQCNDKDPKDMMGMSKCQMGSGVAVLAGIGAIFWGQSEKRKKEKRQRLREQAMMNAFKPQCYYDANGAYGLNMGYGTITQFPGQVSPVGLPAFGGYNQPYMPGFVQSSCNQSNGFPWLRQAMAYNVPTPGVIAVRSVSSQPKTQAAPSTSLAPQGGTPAVQSTGSGTAK